MDPKRCLLRASDCVLDRLADSALGYLDDYRDWRRKGGFEPVVQEYELDSDCRIHIPEGGIRGDLLARELRMDAHAALFTTAGTE